MRNRRREHRPGSRAGSGARGARPELDLAGPPGARPAPGVLPVTATPPPWYAAGLQFGCTGCGACCRREGYVWLSPADVGRLAEFLGLPAEEFLARFTREVPIEGQTAPGISLIRVPHGCIFLDDASNTCQVHSARPTQCRAFPFWPANITSAEAWQQQVVSLCGEEAVSQGPIYSAEEIQAISSRLTTGGRPAGTSGPAG